MNAFDGAPPLRDSVEELASVVTRQNAKLQDVRRQVTELRGQGRAAGERVEVEVNQFGALTALRIDPRAMRLGSQELAEAIMHAAEQGVRDVNAQAEEMMRPLIMELMGTSQRIDASEGEGRDLEDVLAALQDVRHDLRM